MAHTKRHTTVKAARIVEALGDYMHDASGAPGDIQARLMQELTQIRSGLNPNAQKKFEYDVYVYNTMIGNFTGSVDQVLQQMHPYVLTKLVQKYQPLSAVSPMEAPAYAK